MENILPLFALSSYCHLLVETPEYEKEYGDVQPSQAFDARSLHIFVEFIIFFLNYKLRLNIARLNYIGIIFLFIYRGKIPLQKSLQRVTE